MYIFNSGFVRSVFKSCILNKKQKKPQKKIITEDNNRSLLNISLSNIDWKKCYTNNARYQIIPNKKVHKNSIKLVFVYLVAEF